MKRTYLASAREKYLPRGHARDARRVSSWEAIFARTREFHSLYYPLEKQGTACSLFGHILHGKVRVTIWRVRVRVMVRVIWVTIWYLSMNYLPLFWFGGLMQPPTPNVEDQKTFVGVIYPSHLLSTVEPVSGNKP